MLTRLSCALLLASVVFAQESRGTIGGRVVDAHDAAIPHASVVITNVETGVSNSILTNDQGAYVAPLLIPGTYRIIGERPGFKKFIQGSVKLGVNDNLQIDIRLEVGDVTQSVDVMASAPLVQSADASMGLTIGTKELADFPIAQGNPYLIIALAPGTTFEGDQTLNRPYEPTHIVDYSMSGSVSGTTDITLDGVSNTSKGSNGKVAAGYVPPVDAIGEVRVQTSSFDVRTGQSSGGAVNISLRSGTNRLHGSVQWDKTRPEWWANSFFANRSGIPRGDFEYNRWSTFISGPLVIPKVYNGRNKTFFMWTYEGLHDHRPRGGSTNLTVPTADQRKGDFSELLRIGSQYQIYDPATRRLDTGSTTRYREDPFPGNIIPTSRFNPVALKAMEFFALPINSGTTVDHANNYPQPNLTEYANYFTHAVRIDESLSNNDRLSLRGNGYKRNTWRNDYFQTRASGLTEQYKPTGGGIDEVHAFSGSLVLNVRYGYTRFTRETIPLYGRDFDLTTLGFPKALNDAIGAPMREFPVFNINGYFTSLNTGEARFMDTHSLVVAFSKLYHSHSIDFGMEARAYRQSKYNGNSTRSGSYVFDTTWTRGPLDNNNSAPRGQGMAAFLLGLPSASSLIARNADLAEQSTLWSGYVQDAWRAHRRLTVTYGVRYELEGPLTERFDRSIRDFDFGATLPIEAAAKAAYAASYASNPTAELAPAQFHVRGGLVFAGVNGQPRELWNRVFHEIMPRVGLAYTVADRTVVRAGYGIYFNALGLRRADVIQNGFERNTSMVPTKDNGLSFYSTLSNPFPDGIQEPTGYGAGLMTDVGNSITFFNPNPKAGYNQRWQASIQRQFGKSHVVEVAYVGNRATKIEVGRDLNVVGNSLLARSPVFDVDRANYLAANVPNPFRGLPGVNGTLGSGTTITRENLLKPFPQFSGVTTSSYQGYSWYHSLQVRAARSFGTRLGVNASYTWAKNMLANEYLNAADPMPYETISNADRKHRVTFAATYQLPFGRGARLLSKAPRAVNAIVGGWQLSAIYIYQSGLPLGWGDAIFFGNSDDIQNGPHTIDQWFNTKAGFSTNSATRPANHYRSWPLRFSNLRGPAMNNIDANLGKKWRLTERGAELQIRGEAFNAANRPMFGNPTTDQFSTGFGQITTTVNYQRQVQFVARFSF
jgi:hypothetical protein